MFYCDSLKEITFLRSRIGCSLYQDVHGQDSAPQLEVSFVQYYYAQTGSFCLVLSRADWLALFQINLLQNECVNSFLLVRFETRVTSTVSEHLVLTMGWGYKSVSGPVPKSVSGSGSNKGGSSYANGSCSYRNPVNSDVYVYTSQTGYFFVAHILDTKASPTP